MNKTNVRWIGLGFFLGLIAPGAIPIAALIDRYRLSEEEKRIEEKFTSLSEQNDFIQQQTCRSAEAAIQEVLAPRTRLPAQKAKVLDSLEAWSGSNPALSELHQVMMENAPITQRVDWLQGSAWKTCSEATWLNGVMWILRPMQHDAPNDLPTLKDIQKLGTIIQRRILNAQQEGRLWMLPSLIDLAAAKRWVDSMLTFKPNDLRLKNQKKALLQLDSDARRISSDFRNLIRANWEIEKRAWKNRGLADWISEAFDLRRSELDQKRHVFHLMTERIIGERIRTELVRIMAP